MGLTAAISMHYGGNDWATAQIQGLTDSFEDLGIELLTTTDANFSAEQQVSDIENIMTLNPDILISIPGGCHRIRGRLQESRGSRNHHRIHGQLPGGHDSRRGLCVCSICR